jgi:hypothetical protein
MNERQSSPHERMIAYLREGDQLVPPKTRSARDWEALGQVLSAAADSSWAELAGSPDLSPDAWYDDGLDAGMERTVVKWCS